MLTTPTRSRRSCERGSATLEISVLFPALLLLVFVVFQAGLWFFARTVALAAAEEGARVAAAESSSSGDGRAAAESFVSRTSGNLVTNIRVTASRGANQATVTVSARSLSIVPGMAGFVIEQSATIPVERITG